MDNQSPDLGSIIAKLSENPAVLSSLLSVISQSKQESRPTPQTNNIDLEKLFSSLNFNNTNSENNSNSTNSFAANSFSATPNPSPMQNFPSLSPPEKILGSRSDSVNRINLLNALRPYLNESRREKLDLVIKLLKLTELGELSSLLKNLV